ncbi:hypothetical protein D9757_014647 [Collybiopsis confluens]|uniref:Ubiquitin-like protease family profile domain-containing protein n=1 Tax=Collybiopsis confluens TaxID=2823264 RepID=A0A8H5FJ94_9AGAR|nr:hypothetical protein D9757_015176 [Collybiopsis confluens]KAF5346272.1 hypothetical protein D9757_014647 [Collybiopsis confluens]
MNVLHPLNFPFKIAGLKKDDLDRLDQNNLLNNTLIEVGLSPEESYTHVKNWTRTRKNKINVDIFSRDFIIIPIHEQSHWYLAIMHCPFLMLPYHLPTPASPRPHNAVANKADIPQTTIYILDSLNSHHPQVAPQLSSYLQHKARERHNCFNISGAVECIVKELGLDCVLCFYGFIDVGGLLSLVLVRTGARAIDRV